MNWTWDDTIDYGLDVLMIFVPGMRDFGLAITVEDDGEWGGMVINTSVSLDLAFYLRYLDGAQDEQI